MQSHDDASEKPRYKRRTAVVVGAGPAGATAAVYLARHGFNVKVFDRREDLRGVPPDRWRSYFIVLWASTAEVLSNMGVSMPSVEGGFTNGFHTFYGTNVVSKNAKITPSVSSFNRVVGSRADISKCILDVIEEKYSDDVKLNFAHKCQGVCFTSRTVTFEDFFGNSREVEYDLLVAADGVNSVVRKCLKSEDPGFPVALKHPSTFYVSVPKLSVPPEGNVYAKAASPGWMTSSHFRALPGKKGSKALQLFCTPASNGTLSGIVNGSFVKTFHDIRSRTKEWIQTILPRNIPEEWKEPICESLTDVRYPITSTIVRLSKFNGPQTLMIGDAAHALSAGAGFGSNLAISDGAVLDKALRLGEGNIDVAVKAFNDLRYHDVQRYLMLEEGLVQTDLHQTGYDYVWKWMCKTHLLVRSAAQCITSTPRTTPIMLRVTREEISAKQAVSIVKRDCLIFSACVIAMMCLILTILTRLT